MEMKLCTHLYYIILSISCTTSTRVLLQIPGGMCLQYQGHSPRDYHIFLRVLHNTHSRCGIVSLYHGYLLVHLQLTCTGSFLLG